MVFKKVYVMFGEWWFLLEVFRVKDARERDDDVRVRCVSVCVGGLM